MTNEELKQLAIDIYEDKVFTDRHIRPGDMNLVSTIFMPLAFGALANEPEAKVKDIGMFYEYNSEAGPRGINGYPIFYSVKILTKEETEKMTEYYNAYKKAATELKDKL